MNLNHYQIILEQSYHNLTIIKESLDKCLKRLLVNFKSSLLLKIIYKLTKHNNYLQASKLLKYTCTDTKLLKMPSILKLGLN